MTPGVVFVDSAAFVALVSVRDAWHEAAKAIMAQLARDRRSLLTSDWVLTEFLNTSSRHPVRAAALKSVRAILASPAIAVAEASRSDWQRALDLYESRSDKQWSLVDCTSILLCQDSGVTQVFTTDRHFQQAGFEVLLG